MLDECDIIYVARKIKLKGVLKMRGTTREIFDKHEIRKTKEQRRSFRAWLTSYARSQGYAVGEEKVSKGAANVIVGNPAEADVIYTAHYDTCAVMPFPNFITPKCFTIYIIYQLILTAVLFIVPITVMFILAPMVLKATGSDAIYTAMLMGGYALLLGILMLMRYGPANKHTANDNTSGVTLLIDIMTDMPKEMRHKVAYIFFDAEELGTIGSKVYRKKHRKIAETKPTINFDCVSDGKNILLTAKKGAQSLAPKLEEAFKSNGTYTVDVATKGVFYPSDQRNFTRGVGVAALRKTKRGLLYKNKIHTPRDTVYDEENIEFLKDGAIELARII